MMLTEKQSLIFIGNTEPFQSLHVFTSIHTVAVLENTVDYFCVCYKPPKGYRM